jgi:adenosylmethionine-8-amino-7-oxononanoate aminotransferase
MSSSYSVNSLFCGGDLPSAMAYFIMAGDSITPFGKRIYLMPAFVISTNEFNTLTITVYDVIKITEK